MKLYAVLLAYADDYAARRAPYRSDHLANLGRLRASGQLVVGGPWNDPSDGGLMIFRGESRDEVEALVRGDPYCRAGL
jgi:uncharacterized protein YciI